MIRFSLGSFPEGGEYLLMEDGCAIAHSKSFKMVQRLGAALQEFLNAAGYYRVRPRTAPSYFEAAPVEQIACGDDCARPRIGEQRHKSPYAQHGMPDEIEIVSRVGGTVLRYSYVDDPIMLPEQLRRACIHALDVKARELFNQAHEPIKLEKRK